MTQSKIAKLVLGLAIVGLVYQAVPARAQAPPRTLPVRDEDFDDSLDVEEDAAPALPELAPLRRGNAVRPAAALEETEGVPLLEEGYPNMLEEYGDGEEESIGGECGYCGRDDCPTCKHWYARFDLALMHRTRARPQTLSERFGVVTNANGVQSIASTPVFTTHNDKFNLAPGGRITIGRYAGRDERNRDHMWEASYLGFLHFTSQDRIEALSRVTLQRPNLDVDASLASPTYTAGDLFSRFGTLVKGFSTADAHSFKYVSDFNDFQLLRRVRRGQRREQLVYQPGGWTAMPTPNFVPSLIVGPRFININESFSWLSTGFVNWDVDNAFSGEYRIQTNNHLYGAQIGGDLAYTDREWSVGLGVKFGLFVNFAKQTSEIFVDDPTPFRNQLLPASNYTNSAQTRDLSFVGEWFINYSYHITPQWMFRLDYGMSWVTGLALAPEQLSFKVSEGPHINKGGMTIFQGGMMGIEFIY